MNFHPDNFATETHGFYEEFIDAETHKFLGIRMLKTTTRKIGSDGTEYQTLTEPLQLLKGYKRIPVTVKAPRKVISTVQVVCGKLKNQTWKHEQK